VVVINSFYNLALIAKAKFWQLESGELHWHNPVSNKVEVFNPGHPAAGQGPHEEVVEGAAEDPRYVLDIKGSKKSPPKTFYRATSKEGKPIVTGDKFWDSLLFVADNKESIKYYGDSSRTIKAKPTAKILYEGSAQFKKLERDTRKKLKNKPSMLDWASSLARMAKDLGYSAVWFKRQSDLGTAILDPKQFHDPKATKSDRSAGKAGDS
jgi:hypothetical protein